jgi:Rps23 Pro-64 3,4-dihydroxylase Tpa1-like proline 4-hydroxylase
VKTIIDDKNCLVIDDFLDEQDWLCLQDQLECEIYKKVELGEDKVYKLNTGTIFKSHKKYWFSELPWKNNYNPFAQKLKSLLSSNTPSFLPSYQDLSMMVHAYMSGAELSWHRDSGVLGGYSFYCHREWSHMWGGNLLVAHPETHFEGNRVSPPPIEGTDLKDSFGRLYGARGVTFDHDLEKQCIFQPGHGQYIMAKPNRLVILSNKVFHKVERIDSAAGNNSRVSLTGFFE